jgi:polyisoprenoid-binding protein YceI
MPDPPTQPAPTQAPPVATDPPAATEPPQSPTQPSAPLPSGSGVAYNIIPGESKVTYQVGEVFLNQGDAFKVAVGVTPQVSGVVQVDAQNPQNSSLGAFSVDVSQFQSDSSRRDGAIRQRYLESSRYPMVTFTPTQIDGLPASYTEGQEIQLKVSGDLTIREVTKPATFDVTLTLEGGQLTGQATINFLMSEFGFGPISIAGVLNTEDKVAITFDFVARP